MSQDANPQQRRFRLSGRRDREQDVFFEEALDPAIWQPGDDENWDTCWHTGMPERGAFAATGPQRTVNHIPGNNCLTIKSRLYRTMRAMQERVAATRPPGHPDRQRSDFVPRVYSMPEDYHALQQAALDAPEQLWLLKPKNSAKGKDIRLLEDVAETPTDSRWLVQEYLHEPHLMNDRKYVLRLYVLVTSIEPLRVYLYDQGFAKLASCAYDLEDRANPYVHQTNPDVNARNADAESPVVFIDFVRYRKWLREQGQDDEALFRRIRDLVALTLVSAREPMRSASQRFGADPRGCYELIGLDCLIDQDLRPWLLECNLSPSLGVCAAPEDGGDTEAAVKRQLVADMVAMLGLNEPERTRAAPDAPATQIVAEADAELARAGGFTRVYPTPDVAAHLPFFAFPRQADMVLARHVANSPLDTPRATCWRAAEIVAGEALTLYHEGTGEVYAPNPSAALIWLHAASGLNPERIALELAAASGIGPADPQAFDEIRRHCWETVADWAEAGLLVQQPAGEDTRPEVRPQAADAVTSTAVNVATTIRVGRMHATMHSWSAPATHRLAPLLRPLAMPSGFTGSLHLELTRGRAGFTLLTEGRVRHENVTLAALGPLMVEELLGHAPDDGELALTASLVALGPTASGARDVVLICRDYTDADDALAVALGAEADADACGGTCIDVAESGHVTGLGLPLRVAADRDSALIAGLAHGHRRTPPPLWTWRAGHDGHLLPSSTATNLSPCTVRAIILWQPDGDQGADTTHELVATDVHTLLPRLLAGGRQAGAEIPDRDHVTRLATWLASQSLLTLADPDPIRAAGRILRSFPERGNANYATAASRLS